MLVLKNFLLLLIFFISYPNTDGEDIKYPRGNDIKNSRAEDEKYSHTEEGFTHSRAEAVKYANGGDANYSHSLYLDKERTYKVSWKFDNETITFEVQAKSQGWLGLGFSPNGAMTGSDNVVCWFDETGEAHISDRHANENGFPPKDISQDYVLLGGQKTDEGLTFTFRRKINTCDKQDNQITTSATRLIYAFDDVVPKSEDNFTKHELNHRGAKTVYIFDAQQNVAPHLPEDVVTFEFRAKNVSVPDDFHTLYWCEIIEFPDLKKPHHLIRHVPIIQDGSEHIVHHIVLYHCGESMRKYVGKGEACFDREEKNFTKPFLECYNLVFVWGVGGEDFSYPDDVGLLMNAENTSRLFLFEMHYDNSILQKNIVDSSGMKLYLTPTLRKNTAAKFFVASSIGPAYQIIPQGQELFTTYAYCSAECTQAIPPEGWTVVTIFQHEHRAGVKIRLRHIRNGVMLKDIVNDEHYDFSYQNTRPVKEQIKIYPGDELVTECVYTTIDRNVTTYGGFATREEMCFVILDVYPLVDLFTCYSTPAPSETWKIFGANITKDDPTFMLMSDGTNTSLSDFALTQIHFNSSAEVAYYQNAVRNSKHLSWCGKSSDENTNFFQASEMKFQYGYPKVDQFTRDDEDTCLLTGKP